MNEGLTYEKDSNTYPGPNEIAIYLTHRDVQLIYFEYVQHRLANLFSGHALVVMEGGLGNMKGEFVLKYSQKFRESLQERAEKGFVIARVKVNFIVYWNDEARPKELMIILPQLTLRK